MQINKFFLLAAMVVLSACQEKTNTGSDGGLTLLNGTYVAGEPHQNYSMVFSPNGDLFEFNKGKKIGEHKYRVEQDRIVIGGNYGGLRILSPNAISNPGYGEMKKNESK